MIKAGIGVMWLAAGIVGGTLPVQAQNASASNDRQQMSQDRSDEMERVKQSLHAEPALNDAHITVAMEKGKVVIKGFVDSAGDMELARRAVNKSGVKNVVDQLKIQRNDQGKVR